MNPDKVPIKVSNKQGQLGFAFTKGGLREGAGRKSIGITKKVSLTLSEEIWEKVEAERQAHNLSRSELIRNILDSYYSR